MVATFDRRVRVLSTLHIKWVLWIAIVLTVSIRWNSLRSADKYLDKSFDPHEGIGVIDVVESTLTHNVSSHQTTQQPQQYQNFNPSSLPTTYAAPPAFSSSPARFLMGIFTTATEQTQRDLVRQALALYNDTRVCAFGSVNGRLPPPPADHCQLIYTFVMGANPNGTNQIVKGKNRKIRSIAPSTLLITPPKTGLVDFGLEPQNDFTFLNIKENVHNGKSLTWFYYAALVMVQYPSIDYVIKSKSDTFLLVDEFLNHVVPTHFPPIRTSELAANAAVYAGDAVWSYPRRHIYMRRPWYLLSRDLAKFLATIDLASKDAIRWVEDADVGFCLMMRHQMVHLVALLGDDRPWKSLDDKDTDKNTKKGENQSHDIIENVYREWIEQESQRLHGINNASSTSRVTNG